ncbi:hypothetical protein ABE10_00315 [Bacillus toyonensis]|nr:hypothetical protein [Bacillus toyonensis]
MCAACRVFGCDSRYGGSHDADGQPDVDPRGPATEVPPAGGHGSDADRRCPWDLAQHGEQLGDGAIRAVGYLFHPVGASDRRDARLARGGP